MKSARLVLMLTALLAIAACGDQGEYDQTETATPAVQAASEQASPAAQPAAAAIWRLEILETMNSGGYTYVKFLQDGAEKWAAGPETAGLAVGDVIVTDPGMKMSDFHASSLERDFAEIWFVSSLAKEDAAHEAVVVDPHASAPSVSGNTIVPAAGVEAVEPVAGGYSVAGIHEQAAALAGQQVTVRARVVKFTPNIMGTNWIHIQDGSGEGATTDLTVTSSARVAAGDVVLVRGPLSVNKDFGAGYKYAVIIEGAEVTKE